MKLGYKFYRHYFVKFSILSFACLFILWGWSHGEVKAEPGAIVLLAVMIVAGNIGFFFALQKAKRREDAQKLAALVAPPVTPTPESVELALRKRKRMRLFMECWAIGGGILFSVFACSWVYEGIPAPWIGYGLIFVGILGLCGLNVFLGGPLDLRLDRKHDRGATDASTPK